jgi:hypothetical protein
MRGVLKFLLSLIVGIAIIWIGLWWYAQSRLQSGFAAWANQQATAGWKVSYDSLKRGTSPAQATVDITNLSLTPPAGPKGETGTISLPTVALRIDALNPLVFHTDLPDKISIAIGPNIDIAVNTGSIALSENLDPSTLFDRSAYPFRGGDFAASNVDILASQGSLLVLHIDNITSHADINLKASATGTAMATTMSIDGIALSPLLTRIASIPFGGKIAHLGLSDNFSGPVPGNLSGLADQLRAVPHDAVAEQKIIVPVVHQWAGQGGHGNVSVNLVVGPTTAEADAAVKFDANLQPNGTANLTADHLDQSTAAITDAYPQFADKVALFEAQLTPYLTTTDQGGQTLGLHVSYGPGAVNINGQKVSDMAPLNWNTLENPPPAPPPPATAPGDGSGAATP